MASRSVAPKYPVNAALESSIFESAEDDTPRLAYADWLDENGDPDRAAYIRTQIALWDKHPADPDYFDLMERQQELILSGICERPQPKLPAGIDLDYIPTRRFLEAYSGSELIVEKLPHHLRFGDDSYTPEFGDDSPIEGFTRGFPFFAQGQDQGPASAEQALRLREKLPDLFRNTTVRGLRFWRFHGLSRHLDLILETPDVGKLAALWVNNSCPEDLSRISDIQRIQNSGAKNLQWLALEEDVHERDAHFFASAKSERSLRRFQGSFAYCTEEATEAAFTGDWLRGLHRIEVGFTEWNMAGGIRGLAHLPELHTLECSNFHSEAIVQLPEIGPFRSLGRLKLHAASLQGEMAKTFAKAKMPRLSVLQLSACEIGDEELLTLAGSPLFGNLSVLVLDDSIGKDAISAIAESNSARQLRYLELQNWNHESKLAEQGLRHLTTSFPQLTTLQLGNSREPIPRRSLTRFFAEMKSPLRSLSVPFSFTDEAAQKLAKNSALSQLRILRMGSKADEKALTHKGLDKLLTAKNLSNLTYLALGGEDLQKILPLLRDPSVLPSLREMRIGVSNRVGDKIERPRPGLTVRCHVVD